MYIFPVRLTPNWLIIVTVTAVYYAKSCIHSSSHTFLSTTHRKIDPLQSTGHSEQYECTKKGHSTYISFYTIFNF